MTLSIVKFPDVGWAVDYWRSYIGTGAFESDAKIGEKISGSDGKTSLDWSYGGPMGAVNLSIRYRYLKYNLQYDAQGGNPTPSATTGLIYTNTFALADAPTKTGYDFNGWKDGAEKTWDAGASGISGASFTELNDVHDDSHTVKLTAQWVARTCTVTLDPAGGSGGSTSVLATYDAELPSVTPPTRSGWRFDGYWTETGGKGKRYFDADGEGVSPWTETEVTTLYAQWTQKFTVTFFEASKFWKGGTEDTGVICTEEVAYGQNATAPADPEHPGYTFTGWKGNWQNVTQDEKVRATYSDNQYTVRFNANDGSGRTTTQTFAYGEENNLLKNPLPRDGHVLRGWADSASSTTVKYEPGAKVSNLATGGTVDLFALWTPVSYGVIFDANGGDGAMDPIRVDYGEPFAVPDCSFTKAGCEFVDWGCVLGGQKTNLVAGVVVSNLTTRSEPLTFTANWRAYYTMSFDANGGDGQMDDVTYEVGTTNQLPANAYTKTGYGFAGWATNETDAAAHVIAYTNQEEVCIPADANARKTLYAVWSANAYSVVFHANDGTARTTTQDFVYDRPQALDPCPFDRGEFWRFVAWTNETDRVDYANGETVVNLTTGGTYDLTAVWGSNLGDLSNAMGCTNLIWESSELHPGWVPGDGCAVENGHPGAFMYAKTKSAGTLSFEWKADDAGGYIYVGLSETKDRGGDIKSEKYDALQTEWMPVQIDVPASEGEAYLYVDHEKDGFGIPPIYVRNMKWVPAGGGVPTPGEPVAPTAAGVADGAFSLTIPAESGTDYGVWTNADLTVDSWGLMGEPQKGTGSPLKFDWTILPGFPQLFFRAHKVEYR